MELSTLTLPLMLVALIAHSHVVVTVLLIQLTVNFVILEFQQNSALLTAHTQFVVMAW